MVMGGMFVLESEIYWLVQKLKQLELFGMENTSEYKNILSKVKEKSAKLMKAKAFFENQMKACTKKAIIDASFNNDDDD